MSLSRSACWRTAPTRTPRTERVACRCTRPPTAATSSSRASCCRAPRSPVRRTAPDAAPSTTHARTATPRSRSCWQVPTRLKGCYQPLVRLRARCVVAGNGEDHDLVGAVAPRHRLELLAHPPRSADDRPGALSRDVFALCGGVWVARGFFGRGHRGIDVECHVQPPQVDRLRQALGVAVVLAADGER